MRSSGHVDRQRLDLLKQVGDHLVAVAGHRRPVLPRSISSSTMRAPVVLLPTRVDPGWRRVVPVSCVTSRSAAWAPVSSASSLRAPRCAWIAEQARSLPRQQVAGGARSAPAPARPFSATQRPMSTSACRWASSAEVVERHQRRRVRQRRVAGHRPAAGILVDRLTVPALAEIGDGHQPRIVNDRPDLDLVSPAAGMSSGTAGPLLALLSDLSDELEAGDGLALLEQLVVRLGHEVEEAPPHRLRLAPVPVEQVGQQLAWPLVVRLPDRPWDVGRQIARRSRRSPRWPAATSSAGGAVVRRGAAGRRRNCSSASIRRPSSQSRSRHVEMQSSRLYRRIFSSGSGPSRLPRGSARTRRCSRWRHAARPRARSRRTVRGA